MRVLDTVASVPREAFVLSGDEGRAYNNAPLPIGEDQTISQPLIVAMMLQALALRPSDRVLEVGTGSGYQAALLSLMVAHVVTVERIPLLEQRSREVLQRLLYSNVSVYPAGEVLGWPPDGPYDAIVVSAAAPSAPQELVEQLKSGGRMVIPVGTPFEQSLVLVHRTPEGLHTTQLGECRFVPLIGRNAWADDLAGDFLTPA
jgi:protein-L-isoaspartate(D-aspartate) O-methyltransferase